MISIDKAIEFYKGYKDRSGGTVNYNEFDEQMVEWLEELSRRRVEELFRKANEKAIRDKAIDDFVKELKNHYTEYNIDCVLEDVNFYSYTTACNYLEDYIDEIAEHLKAGGENDD